MPDMASGVVLWAEASGGASATARLSNTTATTDSSTENCRMMIPL
jgi:hypothetical protein